jgi:hypothetical protein
MYVFVPIANLAVADTRASGGQLNVSSFQDFDVIHAVLAVHTV